LANFCAKKITNLWQNIFYHMSKSYEILPRKKRWDKCAPLRKKNFHLNGMMKNMKVKVA
jgi:hypothetical protein